MSSKGSGKIRVSAQRAVERRGTSISCTHSGGHYLERRVVNKVVGMSPYWTLPSVKPVVADVTLDHELGWVVRSTTETVHFIVLVSHFARRISYTCKGR